MFFMELISVGNEDTKYLINRFVLQECGKDLELCLTGKNQWGYSQVMVGVGFRVLVLNHFPSSMKVNILKIVPVVIVG